MSSKREARLEKKTREIAYLLYQDRLIFGRDGNATEDWTKASWIAQDPFREFLFSFRFLFRSNESIEAFIYENFGDFSIGTFIANSSKELGGKTLWSWAELLLVPGLLAWGAFYLENRVEERQERIAADRVEQEILSNYLSEMSDLLVDAKLRESYQTDNTDQTEPNSENEAWIVAQALTSTTMKELGSDRNALLINFLRQSKLIGEHQEGEKGPSLLKELDLTDADLSGAFLVEADLEYAELFNADLSGADLSGADLSGATLSEADLSGAYLEYAYLSSAYLIDADLRGANLSVAKLFNADLRGANLFDANLFDARLIIANLISANLFNADLRGADLSEATLSEADLSGARLSGANLDSARLSDANIEGAYLCNTTLPSYIDDLDPNRDCGEEWIPGEIKL